MRKRIQYLIQWEGYPLEDATWEPAENIDADADALIRFQALQTKIPQKPKSTRRKGRTTPAKG